MTEDNDSRNEVWRSRSKIDPHTQLTIDKQEIQLKSKGDSIDDLIRKAREAIEKP